MQLRKNPQLKTIAEVKSAPDQEHFGEIWRSVVFSPKVSCSNFMKMAYVEVPPGAVGTAHIHLGEELVYTIKGKAVLTIEGTEYLLEEGSFFQIPPDVPHPARVVGDEPWIAVAAYCDECCVLKEARGKQGVDYPVNVEQTSN